ncbi:MAG TPA: AMP-binding protein [Burkholderiales bacterium]|nr:AMP-binding protein [Burkholderiales bacterium]
MAERTIPQLFETSVASFPDNVLMWEKKDGRYQGTTYRAARTLVHAFAAGLKTLGLGRGERAALIAEGRNDWLVSELGVLYNGAVNVPISVKIDELSDLKFRLSHSGTKCVIVSRSQVGKIRQIKGDLPELQKTVLLDEMPSYEPDEVLARDVFKMGESYLAAHEREFDETWRSIKENDYANICYTSGTTADPKGIILTHLNYVVNTEQSRGLVDCPEYYVSLLYLPWDHAFCHTAGVYTLIRSGAALASVDAGRSFMESVKNIPLNIKEIRPHFLFSVPAFAKTFRKGIEKGVRDKGPTAEKLFRKGLKVAYAYNAEGWNRGRGLRKLRKPLYFLYDLLIFKKIRRNFGGRLEFFIGGGALLDIELQRFFYALGVPMFQGYGLTEAAPVISANSKKAHKLGSSGKIVPGLELRICDESGAEVPAGEKGEIVIRGENVMAGYWKNEKASSDALRGGWLYTGDIGYVDRDGFLYVLGRVKSLLIGNDGEKYSPEVIEEEICDHSPYIEQLMLYNNQSPYTVALLVPNKETVRRWLEGQGLSARTPEGQEAALRLLESEVNAFREGGPLGGRFPGRWLPSAIAVLGEPFSEQNQFLNSMLKMVRGKIAHFYSSRLDHLFTPEAKAIVNPQNRAIIARWES